MLEVPVDISNDKPNEEGITNQNPNPNKRPRSPGPLPDDKAGNENQVKVVADGQLGSGVISGYPRHSKSAAHNEPEGALFTEIESTSPAPESPSARATLGVPTVSVMKPSHIEAAWEHFRKLGSPRFHVAPMVDQSELPFRMLCRKYGADAAYTPMLHSRLFAEDPKYRLKEFSTCRVCELFYLLFIESLLWGEGWNVSSRVETRMMVAQLFCWD